MMSGKMKTAYIAIFATLCLVLPGTARSSQTDREKTKAHATGSFDVKIDPQPADERSGAPTLGRMLIDKHFHGDLEATSKGTMLATGTGAKGTSGGYVAMEIVTGSLKGRTGTFVLQHAGTMTRGNPQLTVTIVPDSGTGQLTGIAGTMSINIIDGKHSYDLEYALPTAP